MYKSTPFEELNIDKEGGLVILPDKFAVIKVIDQSKSKVDSNPKVFVNVTHHPAIDKPAEKNIATEEQVHEMSYFVKKRARWESGSR